MTKEFQWYEHGKNYNNNLPIPYYTLVDVNWDFFYGLQWPNAGLDDELSQPVFNNINRFATFFVAAIMASKPAVLFESPLREESDTEGELDEQGVPIEQDEDISDDVVNQSWAEFEERVKLTWKIKNALYDGAVTGDYVAHLRLNPDAKPYNGTYSDVEGEIDFDLVDPNNFYVSNPNSRDIQSQNYIQIAGRDTIKALKGEREEVSEVMAADNDTVEQASIYGQIEMESGSETDKATYLITYTKKYAEDKEDEEYDEDKEPKKKKRDKRKTVHATKCTKSGYVYKDVDLGVELYPVAHGNWELQRNTYHGMSFVTTAIPTQIFINRGFAMAMTNVLTTSMPKLLYNKNMIGGFSTRVGGQIGADLKPGDSLANVAQYLAPGNMSAQVIQMIELAQRFMQETVGATDSLLGNVNPEQASGVSIAVTSKQAGVPLENPKSNMYNWLEDIAKIYLDMISHLYGTRPVIMPAEDGATLVEFNFDELQGMYKVVKVEVGPSSYWSEIAVKETLDNLLAGQYIEFIDYLERMPEGYVKDKQGLIDKIKENTKMQEQQLATEEEYIASLSEADQIAYRAMPEEQRAQIFAQGQAGGQDEVPSV